jgi:hypothetical protein
MRVALALSLCAGLGALASTGRALDGLSAGPSVDLAAPRDGGAPADLAQRTDLARKPDLAQPGTSCGEIFSCLEGCVDDACASDCLDAGTPEARQAFDDLTSCAETACGAVCADPDGDCDACFEAMQSPPGTCEGHPQCGACFEELETCFS